MSEELKPCPFCGGEATICQDTQPSPRPECWIVSCENEACLVTSWCTDQLTENAAIKAWNTRARLSTLNKEE